MYALRAKGEARGQTMTHLDDIRDGPPLALIIVLVILVLTLIIGGLTCCVLKNFSPANTVGPAYETKADGGLTSIGHDSGLLRIKTVNVEPGQEKSSQVKGQRLQGHDAGDAIRVPSLSR